MEYGKLERRGREKYLDKAVLPGLGYIRHGLLGQGTFSDVYCVEDEADGRLYACKVSGHVEMLEREARAMEGVVHPLFPRCVSFWTGDNLGILLREYAAGSCLKEMLERRHFSVAQTARVGIWLAEGLWYLHGRPERLLFRDVKPANIIICQDGGVKLVDFGCACAMAEEVTSRAGSPGFAAPEQLREGGVLTEACDVYGLGRTLEAMLGEEGEGRGASCVPDAPGVAEASGQPMGEAAETVSDRAGCRIFHSAGRGAGPGKKRRRGISVHMPARERRARRRLLSVLRACTEEEMRERIADMERVVWELKRIYDRLQ